jgi:hypothetical protein
VEHEREALRRRQRLEHHLQRQTDGISQQCLVLGIDAVHPVDKQIGEPPGERLLLPCLTRAQHVQTDPPDDGRQPGIEVVDATQVGAAEAKPGFLHGVGLAQRAEHPVGHSPQLWLVVLESRCQRVLLFHRSHSVVALRRRGDERKHSRSRRGENPIRLVVGASAAIRC